MQITNHENRSRLESEAQREIGAMTPDDLPKLRRFLSVYFKQQIGAKLAEKTDIVLYSVCLTHEWGNSWALIIKGEGHKAFREWFVPVKTYDWTHEPAEVADFVARRIINN